MPSPLPARRRLAVALLAALVPSAIGADVIHLKNGATIEADSWVVEGDLLAIRQRNGTIRVPRAEVERIEASASPAPSPAPPAPAATASPPSREEILAAIATLRRRLDDFPMARAENSRRIAMLLSQLGMRAYKERDLDEAGARFREALSFDARDPGAQLGMAAVHLRQGRDIDARTLLERALLDHPEHAEMHALLGDVYDSQDRPEDALAEWRRALALRPDDALRRRIEKLEREHAVDADYRKSDAPHFTLKYDGALGGTDLGAEILAFLEAEFTTLVGKFDHYPAQPIVVIIYPQKQFYEATQAESDVAGLYDGKIRVPIGGLVRLHAQARRVLLHELAHAFIAGKSRGAAPRWLHEGMAQQVEGQTTSRAAGIALAREFEAPAAKESWGERFSYPSALSFVEHLVETEGFHRLVEVLESLSEGGTIEGAFERATHYTLKELRESWGRALADRYLQ